MGHVVLDLQSLPPGPDDGRGVRAAVCLVCGGVAGGGKFGSHSAVAQRAGRGAPAAACRLAPARAVGLEPGECYGALAPGGQKPVCSSLIPHSIQLGSPVSICVLTSARRCKVLTTCALAAASD